MTAAELISQLEKRGVEISRKTLFTYRAADPGKAPAGFDAVDDWARFILERQIYEPGRTQAPEKREAKERRAMSRNGTESSGEDQNGEYAEYSAAVERRERIIKLRLANEVRRTSLEQLSRSTITIAECVETMERIRAVVSGDLLGVPVNLCQRLAHRDPGFIQQVLEAALRSSLERLSRRENYLCSNHDRP
jgi:hypothetical protein